MKITYTDVRSTHSAKGRGVFALKAFQKGDRVEISPVFVVRAPWEALPEDVQKVVYEWGQLGPTPQEHVWGIALGVGSLFNHANPANLEYRADWDQQTLHFYAARDIEKDEELTINYNENGEVVSTQDTWFEQVGVEPL